jgi:uncharacterized protein YjiS (DUF1127 family)
MKTIASGASPQFASIWTAMHDVLDRSVNAVKSAHQQRRLDAELSRMDARLLRDIGVEQDEIARIQAGDSIVPRSWVA